MGAEFVVDIEVDGMHYTPELEAGSVSCIETEHGSTEATFTLLDPDFLKVLAEDCEVVISDPYDGATVWTGMVAGDGLRTGRGIGLRAGHRVAQEVTCVGSVARCYDTSWSLPYIVRGLDMWGRESIKYRSHVNFDTSVGTRPMDPPWEAIVSQVRDGAGAYPGMQGRTAYLGHLASDMWIGGWRGRVDAGRDESAWRVKLEVGDGFYGNIPLNIPWSTTTELYERKAGQHPNWPAAPTPGQQDPSKGTGNYLVLSSMWDGGTAGFKNESQSYWTAISNVVVAGQRVDKYGQNTSMPDITTVLASDIVADLIGRCLVGIIDPVRSVVETTDFAISQADYTGAYRAGDILDDMQMLHQGHFWRIGHPDASTQTRLSAMTWREWDTEPRYVLPDDTSLDLQGTGDPLADQVVVTWIDWKGRPQKRTYTADPDKYPDIAGMAGRRQPDTVDLGEELGEAAIADRVGTAVLDVVARRARAGTATITDEILDASTQTLVRPSRIEAGSIVITADGEQYRCTEVRKTRGETVLTLDNTRRTVDQIIAARGRRARR